MSRVLYKLEQKDGRFDYSNALPPSLQIPSDSSNGQVVQTPPPSSLSRISPVLVLVIILLAVIFFISGLLHLLFRFLIKRPSSSSSSSSSPIFQSNPRLQETTSGSHVVQRQLRQLFRLHDSGLDQAVIDALPVFYYKDIVGLKEPFDCAVCLCEFSDRDELRLLPACSHAFHIDCIGTWLLSNSTCPLCRHALLVSDIFLENPMLIFDDHVDMSSGLSSDGENRQQNNRKSVANVDQEGSNVGVRRVFSVRLGKFRSLNGGGAGNNGGETSRCNLDARRCYSMGTFQYVVGDSDLQVALSHARSGVRRGKFPVCSDSEGKKISGRQKGESFSVSKIWLWSKTSRFPSCSDTDISLPTSLNVSFSNNNQTQTARITHNL